MNRTNRAAHLGLSFLTIFGLLLIPLGSGQIGHAQTEDRPDTQAEAPWIGCWEPTRGGATTTKAATGFERGLCIIPHGEGAGIELITFDEGAIAERAHLDPTSGIRNEISVDQCNGWERATWSGDGKRIYLASELTCPGDITRESSGLLTLSTTNELLHIESLTTGENTMTRAVRYRAVESSRLGQLPAELLTALTPGQSFAAKTARGAVAGKPTLSAIIDATDAINPAALQSWLVEEGKGFYLDAAKMIELDEAGVASEVLDLIVALSYPETFSIAPAPSEAAFSIAEVREPTTRGTVGADAYDLLHLRYMDPYLISPFSLRYGYGLGFGYGLGYGHGLGLGYDYGWYTGRSPVVIIRESGSNDEQREGRRRARAVKGKGYTQGRPEGNAWPGQSSTIDRKGPRSSAGQSGIGSRSNSDQSRSSSRPTRTAKPRGSSQ